MKAANRTWLGIVLAVPLAVILLAMFACLPAPVGDPEKAKVDDSLNGAWQGVNTDATSTEKVLVLLRPWDGKTYLMQYITVDTAGGKDQHQMMHFKAWLTTLGGATFITCQPLDDLKYVAGVDPAEKPYWAVLRLDKTATGLDARMVSPDSDLVKDQTTRAQLEATITAHAGDAALYGDTISFKKLGKEDAAMVKEMLGKFNTEENGDEVRGAVGGGGGNLSVRENDE